MAVAAGIEPAILSLTTICDTTTLYNLMVDVLGVEPSYFLCLSKKSIPLHTHIVVILFGCYDRQIVIQRFNPTFQSTRNRFSWVSAYSNRMSFYTTVGELINSKFLNKVGIINSPTCAATRIGLRSFDPLVYAPTSVFIHWELVNPSLVFSF